MDSIRIQNLRCLKDSGVINIKDLTVVVGRNSSGKSTLLRFFPLIRQTIETKIEEPILWYGKYVDFGSFDESKNKDLENDNIAFEFTFNVYKNQIIEELNRRKWRYLGRGYDDKSEESGEIKMKIEMDKSDIKYMQICFFDNDIEMKLDNKNCEIKINGSLYKVKDIINHTNGLVPRIFFKKDKDSDYRLIGEYFESLIKRKIKDIAHHSTSDDTIMNTILNIKVGSSNDIYESIRNCNMASSKLKDKLKKIKMDDEDFIEIKNLLIGSTCDALIDICSRLLFLEFSSVRYIAPIRATAQRYYRIQGLAVDEIDPQGDNIPSVLNNMRKTEKDEFDKWTKKNFGFVLIIQNRGGHISIEIESVEKSGKVNLADTGFGYSQILPIILVIWDAIHSRKNNYGRTAKIRDTRYYRQNESKKIIVIEQPELHLHPELQAKLTDMFIKMVEISKEKELGIKIIIETHSENILNRIGYNIAKNKTILNNKDISILIFNKINEFETVVETTDYSEKGYLNKWPIGFFSPEV